MFDTLISVLIGLLIAGADDVWPAGPPPAGHAGRDLNAWMQDRPPPPPPEGPRGEGRPRPRVEPAPDGARRQAPGDPPPGPPARPPRPRRAPDAGPPPPGDLGDQIIHLLLERRPELGRKLADLRERSPEQFEDVLADALAARLGEALDRAERAPDRPRAPRGRPGVPRAGEPGWPGGGPPPAGPRAEAGPRDMRARAEPLRARQRELQALVDTLVTQLQALRRHEADADEKGSSERELMSRLERAVNDEFDVRTELRRLELERIERELDRLQQSVSRIRDELSERERGRGVIIERRMRELVREPVEEEAP
jgi:hypothetical protein